jgi:ABC-type multidrug transport system fused ATPase/permease subunit
VASSTAVPEKTDAALAVLPDVSAISNRALLAWMFRFLRPVKAQVFFACSYLALAVGAEVLAVKQTGRAADLIQRLTPQTGYAPGFFHWIVGPGGRFPTITGILQSFQGGRNDFSALLAGLVIITTFFLFLRYRRFVAETRLSMMMVFYIREAVYDKLQRVGFGFHDALSSGQLINRALTDLQNVRAFIQTAVLTTLEILLIVGGYMALVFTLSPVVAVLSLLPLPIWTWYILRFSKRVQPAARAVMEADDRNVAIIAENISGVHVVKAFAIEDQEIQRYGAHCGTFLQRVRTRIRLFANFTPVIRGIASASYLILFLAAGLLMIHGKLRAGDFLILGSAMGQILSRLQAVSVINEQYQNAIVSSRRLYEVLFAPPTVAESPAAIPLAGGPGAVSFENVTFGYDPRKAVINEVSFHIKGGSRVAIVGPTGSGKTTLVNLLARFYDPGAGTIRIDGIDLRDLSLASLRTQVAFVFQETYLFSDTVAANIAYGRPNISRGDIEAASRLAQAHEFIDQLPLKYETMLGERGSSLSGGQKQRLAIARAILTNPRILVLDDATASVDPETEDLIRRGMRFVMEGRTTFVIAHRVSTVKQADVVLVLEQGRLTQMGKHDQLMREEGHYREIARVQLFGDSNDTITNSVGADLAEQQAGDRS